MKIKASFKKLSESAVMVDEWTAADAGGIALGPVYVPTGSSDSMALAAAVKAYGEKADYVMFIGPTEHTNAGAKGEPDALVLREGPGRRGGIMLSSEYSDLLDLLDQNDKVGDKLQVEDARRAAMAANDLAQYRHGLLKDDPQNAEKKKALAEVEAVKARAFKVLDRVHGKAKVMTESLAAENVGTKQAGAAIVKKWFDRLGVGFHPDTDGKDYLPSLESMGFDPAEYNADMAQAYSDLGDAIYEVGSSLQHGATLPGFDGHLAESQLHRQLLAESMDGTGESALNRIRSAIAPMQTTLADAVDAFNSFLATKEKDQLAQIYYHVSRLADLSKQAVTTVKNATPEIEAQIEGLNNPADQTASTPLQVKPKEGSTVVDSTAADVGVMSSAAASNEAAGINEGMTHADQLLLTEAVKWKIDVGDKTETFDDILAAKRWIDDGRYGSKASVTRVADAAERPVGRDSFLSMVSVERRKRRAAGEDIPALMNPRKEETKTRAPLPRIRETHEPIPIVPSGAVTDGLEDVVDLLAAEFPGYETAAYWIDADKRLQLVVRKGDVSFGQAPSAVDWDLGKDQIIGNLHALIAKHRPDADLRKGAMTTDDDYAAA